MSASPVGFDASQVDATGTKLERAYLLLHEPNPSNTMSSPGARYDRIDFQFNPKELTVGKQADWKRENAQGSSRSSPPQYKGPQPSKLTLEMFLDATEKQDTSVVKTVEKLMGCCTPTPGTKSDPTKASPPWVIFRWGGLTGFLSYVSSVQAKYTVFSAGGVPIRAVCTVTLEELSGEPPRQNPTSGSPVTRRVHRVTEGDTLAGVAFREYGKASLWRELAQANDIDDPMRLRVGSTLLLPAHSELVPESPEEGALVDHH